MSTTSCIHRQQGSWVALQLAIGRELVGQSDGDWLGIMLSRLGETLGVCKTQCVAEKVLWGAALL
jgi:hypothetical protein